MSELRHGNKQECRVPAATSSAVISSETCRSKLKHGPKQKNKVPVTQPSLTSPSLGSEDSRIDFVHLQDSSDTDRFGKQTREKHEVPAETSGRKMTYRSGSSRCTRRES